MVSLREIENRLRLELNPSRLEVTDESLNHRGHLNYREGLVTHIKIKIKSDIFKGKTKISIHQLIYNLLAEEIKTGLHAISIEAKE